jgi:hypothetical protein
MTLSPKNIRMISDILSNAFRVKTFSSFVKYTNSKYEIIVESNKHIIVFDKSCHKLYADLKIAHSNLIH